MPRDAREEAAPIERDDSADAAALEAMRKETADQIAAAAQAQEAAEQAAEAERAKALNGATLPTCNAFLHSYRQLEPSEQEIVRRVKDLYWLTWTALHELDGSAPEATEFQSRELGFASIRLQESALWLEAAFHV